MKCYGCSVFDLQECWLQHCPGQPVTVLHHSLHIEIFPTIQSECPLALLETRLLSQHRWTNTVSIVVALWSQIVNPAQSRALRWSQVKFWSSEPGAGGNSQACSSANWRPGATGLCCQDFKLIFWDLKTSNCLHEYPQLRLQPVCTALAGCSPLLYNTYQSQPAGLQL